MIKTSVGGASRGCCEARQPITGLGSRACPLGQVIVHAAPAASRAAVATRRPPGTIDTTTARAERPVREAGGA